MVVANVFRPWGGRVVCQRRRRQARHAGRAHRALPGRRYDRQRAVRAQQGGGVQPVQMDGLLPRGGPRPFPRRSSEVSSWMRITRRGPGRRRCELVLRSQYRRTGDGGAFLSMLLFALASALTVTVALPAVAPPRLLGGFAGNGRRFRHGPGLLCGFRRGLFAVGSADLGKRRRLVAFRADSACKTAQKFADGVRESLGERGMRCGG